MQEKSLNFKTAVKNYSWQAKQTITDKLQFPVLLRKSRFRLNMPYYSDADQHGRHALE